MAHCVLDPKETPMTTPMTPANRGQKTKSQKAKSAVLCALVALNVLLVAILVTRHMPENRAMAAQVNAGDILAVPGHLNGFPNGVVFLLDNTSGSLTAISFDQPTNSMTWLPQPVDIRRLANNAGGVRGK
jgi:hypothetical protein